MEVLQNIVGLRQHSDLFSLFFHPSHLHNPQLLLPLQQNHLQHILPSFSMSISYCKIQRQGFEISTILEASPQLQKQAKVRALFHFLFTLKNSLSKSVKSIKHLQEPPPQELTCLGTIYHQKYVKVILHRLQTFKCLCYLYIHVCKSAVGVQFD